MLRGKSLGHVPQGLGASVSVDTIGGYYNDLREKVLRDEQHLDSVEPFPVKDEWGEHFFPTAVFQYGLGAFDLYLEEGDPLMREKVLTHASWALDHQEDSGLWNAFGFAYPAAPYGSMAQGEGALQTRGALTESEPTPSSEARDIRPLISHSAKKTASCRNLQAYYNFSQAVDREQLISRSRYEADVSQCGASAFFMARSDEKAAEKRLLGTKTARIAARKRTRAEVPKAGPGKARQGGGVTARAPRIPSRLRHRNHTGAYRTRGFQERTKGSISLGTWINGTSYRAVPSPKHCRCPNLL